MVTIRQMEIPDLDQVLPIEEANFSTPWTANGFFTFLIREDALFLTAEEDGEILGYCGIILSLDEGEITNVCVREDCRKRGIGQMLMEGLIRERKKQGSGSGTWRCARATRARSGFTKSWASCRTG